MAVTIAAERQIGRLRQRLACLDAGGGIDRHPARSVSNSGLERLCGAREGDGDAADDQGNLQFGHLASPAVLHPGWMVANIDARRLAAAEISPRYRIDSARLSGSAVLPVR